MKTSRNLPWPVGIGLLAVAMTASACQQTGGCPGGTCGMPATECDVCAPVSVETAAPVVEVEIATPVLERLIASGVKLTILDARTGKWDDGLRIPGAQSLSPQATLEEIQKVVENKEALIVTYCSNPKCPASRQLAKHLMELGYRNVMEYTAGIAGWKEAGHEVVKVR